METVEVVIRIPKEDFEELQSNYAWWGKHGEYIKKGTVLPKGHGKLVDVSLLYQNTMHYSNRTRDLIMKTVGDSVVVEADKEGEVHG